MNKKKVQERVLQDGKPLSLDLFTWCEETRTFSSNENHLVIDFYGIGYCTIKAGWHCMIKTGAHCMIKTGWHCMIKTGRYCTIKTDSNCTIETYSDGTFNSGHKCVVVRRDVFEVIKLEENKPIKLNSYGTPGFVYLDDKKVTIELTQDQLDKIKQQGII